MTTARNCLLFFTAVLMFAPVQSLADSSMTAAQRFQEVQSLRRQGELDNALVQLDALRNDFPMDVDYSLARAQVLSQLQRDDEALAELEIAAALAPDYEEVSNLRAALLARQQRASGRWTVVMGAGHEELSNNLPSWNSQFAELHFAQDDSSRYRLRLARDARYSAADTSIGFGAEQSWPAGWYAGVDLSVASNPIYQPELAYSAHAGKSLPDGWVLNLRYRRKDYASATVGSAIGTVEKYFGDYRIAYGLGWSRLHGASNFANHVLTFNWYYSDDSSVGVTVNTGNEAESLGNGQVLETDVNGLTLSGRRAISERVGIQWWLGVHNQGDFYRRRFLGMAVSIGI